MAHGVENTEIVPQDLPIPEFELAESSSHKSNALPTELSGLPFKSLPVTKPNKEMRFDRRDVVGVFGLRPAADLILFPRRKYAMLIRLITW